MMRLPEFTLRTPRTIDEAAAWLAESPQDSMLIAGGTDLLPNMKRRQQTPRQVIALGGLAPLKTIARRDDGSIAIGAGTTLTTIAHDASIRRDAPGLWQAVAQIATPPLRNMGTIGGNLCLDTRCTYYDQSLEWRKAIDFCMKKDGSTCWVATSSPRCLAVSSTDRRTDAAGARRARATCLGERHARDRRRRSLSPRRHALPHAAARRDPHGDRHARSARLAQRLLEAAPPRIVRLPRRLCRRGRADRRRASRDRDPTRPRRRRLASARSDARHRTPEPTACSTTTQSPRPPTPPTTIAKPMDNTDFELIWRKKAVRALVTYALREIRGDDTREARLRMARQVL